MNALDESHILFDIEQKIYKLYEEIKENNRQILSCKFLNDFQKCIILENSKMEYSRIEYFELMNKNIRNSLSALIKEKDLLILKLKNIAV